MSVKNYHRLIRETNMATQDHVQYTFSLPVIKSNAKK